MLNNEPVRSCSRSVHCVHSPIDRHRRPSEHRSRAAKRAVRRARHRAAAREAVSQQDIQAEKCAPAAEPAPEPVPEPAAEPAPEDEVTDLDEPMPDPEDQELLILLDWDDTVLPTTFLSLRRLNLDTAVPEDVEEVLRVYADVVLDTLRCLRTHGRVVIVTNAETGWVELTCAKFLPALVPELHDVERVSARSLFEPRGHVTPVEWKTEAFHEQVELHLAQRPSARHVLSIGDAGHEREAVYRVAQRLDVTAKSIKLVEQPDVAYLTREHALIQERLADLLQHEGPLDVRVDAEA